MALVEAGEVLGSRQLDMGNSCLERFLGSNRLIPPHRNRRPVVRDRAVNVQVELTREV
jgi:hypothetical protein